MRRIGCAGGPGWSNAITHRPTKIIRFSITTVWTFAYVHLSELFPTVVRSLALGLISAGGTLGSMSSAFVGNLSQDMHISPLLSLGVVGAVGSLFVLPLRETFKEPLADEIMEDVEVIVLPFIS